MNMDQNSMSTFNVWYVLLRGEEKVSKDFITLVEGQDSVAHLREAVYSKWSNHLQNLIAPQLKVYKAGEQEPLDPSFKLKRILGNNGCELNPLLVVIPSVWYTLLLVQGSDTELQRITENWQDLPETARVRELKSAVFSTWSSEISGKVLRPEDLQVYASEEAQRGGAADLATIQKVFDLTTGTSKNNPFFIVAEKHGMEEGSSPDSAKKLKRELIAFEELKDHNHQENLIFENQIASPLVFSAPKSPGEFPEDVKEGDVVVITRQEGNIKFQAPLYIRKHLVSHLKYLSDFLAGNGKNKVYATGAPGCGKTCFFWMWACILMKLNKRVLFIQYRQEFGCCIWVFECGEMKELSKPYVDQKNVEAVVYKLLLAEAKQFDVCICDGVISDDTWATDLRRRLNSFLGVKFSKLALVSSLQFRIPQGQEDRTLVRKLMFDSWRKEEFFKAVTTDFVRKTPSTLETLRRDWEWLTRGHDQDNAQRTRSFLNHAFKHACAIQDAASVLAAVDKICEFVGGSLSLSQEQILDVVNQKFDYAGGSARYMFHMSIEDLLVSLDEDFDAIQDKTEFTRTSMAGKSLTAINSLMQQFTFERTSRCTPVSKYVLLLAYEHCRSKLTDAVKAVAEATCNPVLKGWAFELGQLDMIRKQLDANICARADGAAHVRHAVQNSKLKFFPTSKAIFDGNDVKGDVVNGSVIWCKKFNQPLFDVAFYLDNETVAKTLVTIQLTVSTTHSLKLAHMRTIRRAIASKAEVNRVVHLGVIEENVEEFRFETATGTMKVTRSGAAPHFSVQVDISSELKNIWSAEVDERNWVFGANEDASSYFLKL